MPSSNDPNATASDWIFTFINVALGVVGIISVAFIIYGGFRYVTAGGNDDSSESAKKIITNAVIGLVVVILSAVVVNVIINGLVWRRV
ncbi:MAG: Mbov_0395 family pilin-like conjugal transfer protein [Candidatus Saccharibacteria bacterium]